MEQRKEVFQYSYSAKQQEEIAAIRKKYLPPQEDKMELLRRLDQSTTKTGRAVSLVLGIVGCLVLGSGLYLVMKLGGDLFVPGIVLGVAGIALVAVAYPVYSFLTKQRRKKVASRIVQLTDELSREN